MINSVKNYIKQGFNVIPVNHDKTPACDWKYYQSNQMDNFKLFTTDSIAVICGKISDNLTVLDFDNHQGTAKENLTKFITHPVINDIFVRYKLPVIETQSKGYHIYLRADKLNGNEKLAQIKINGKLDVIIESRGEGGYVLAPPSNGYKVIRNEIKELQYIEDWEYNVIFEVARSFNQINAKIFKPNTQDLTPWNIYDELPESIIEAKQILSNHGWNETGFNNSWIRPGKNKGISATFGNVAPNVFYVFTSSTEFENQHGYKPSAIKAILEFNGDFKECAKVLSEKYSIKPVKQEKPQINLQDKLKKCFIDTSKPLQKPPVILSIRNEFNSFAADVMTLGNISVIKGFAKSKKTYSMMIFASSLLKNSEIFRCIEPSMSSDKRNIIYIDTEQSEYHSQRLAKRIEYLGKNKDFLIPLNMRGLPANEIKELLSFIVETYPNIGLIIIDQVADLVKSLNSEEEAVLMVRFLEMITKQYNIHISCVVHINKADNFAQGWLGTQLMKKAESIIHVEKDRKVNNMSYISADLMRGIDFEPLAFYINDEGLPELFNRNDIQKDDEI